MATNDTLANMLSKTVNAIQAGKKELVIKPISKVIVQVLEIFKKHEYIQDYTRVEDGRGDHIIIKGFDRINKCGVIKPRYDFAHADSIEVEQQYLPAKGFGIVIVSTSQGIMTLDQAKEKQIGGKLICYCY